MLHRPSTANQVRRLWENLSPQRRVNLLVLAVLMIVVSFAEVLSIGAILPFLAALTSPEKIFAYEFAQPVIRLLKIQSKEEVLLPFTIVFVATVLLAGLARVTLLWVQTRLSMAIGADFSIQAYKRTLYQPYSLHVTRNSSEILAGARKAEGLVVFIILPVLIVISSLVIFVAIISVLLAIQPTVALTAFLGFGVIYASVILFTKHRIGKNSRIIAAQQIRVTKALQEGLGGIRDVLIDGTQLVYSRIYEDAFIPMQRAVASNQVVAAGPRFGVEALGMTLIAILAYVMTEADGVENGVAEAVPVLGALTLGAQRLLPVLQQIYNSYITIKGNQASIEDALELLSQPMPSFVDGPLTEPVAFEAAITLKNVSFRYNSGGPYVLKNVNLKIEKGSRVGIIGVTGSGKSTLVDIVMGLLNPTDGSILIDDITVNPSNTRGWQRHISHVPQVIYLSDTNIRENIAFGIPPELIDYERVKQAAKQAQIAQTIESWRDSYNTLIGERGVRLSGGQRQRIGIARALYKCSSLIILDEATSALDNETESSVMAALESLGRDLTILIIAHRITTLKNCDQIVELVSGEIKSLGGYDEMIQRVS